MENLNQFPLYPNEYTNLKSNEVNNEQESALNGQNNTLLPLLLSMIQGNESGDLIKLLPALTGQNSDGKIIEALASTLANNKKKTASTKTEVVDKKPFPKNEFVY